MLLSISYLSLLQVDPSTWIPGIQGSRRVSRVTCTQCCWGETTRRITIATTPFQPRCGRRTCFICYSLTPHPYGHHGNYLSLLPYRLFPLSSMSLKLLRRIATRGSEAHVCHVVCIVILVIKCPVVIHASWVLPGSSSRQKINKCFAESVRNYSFRFLCLLLY